MPADNEMPDVVREYIVTARACVDAWQQSPQWTQPSAVTAVWLADALDRAQRERDEGVYADIRAERARQDAQWGGPEHDDRHIISDWRDYRQKFEHRASVTVSGSNQAMRRDALVKIAALAVAQVEALDREHPRASLSPERSSRDR